MYSVLIFLWMCVVGCGSKMGVVEGASRDTFSGVDAQLLLLPDAQSQMYALMEPTTGRVLLQTDVGIHTHPLFVVHDGYLVVVVQGHENDRLPMLYVWDIAQKTKLKKESALVAGKKTDLLFLGTQILISGQGEETLEVLGWPELEKQRIEGWTYRKSIEAINAHKGLVYALDNFMTSKYVIIFEPTSYGVKYHSDHKIYVGTQTHYIHAEMNDRYWVTHRNWIHMHGSGSTLSFIDISTFPPSKKDFSHCEELGKKKEDVEESNTEIEVVFSAEIALLDENGCPTIFYQDIISQGTLMWSTKSKDYVEPIDFKFRSDGKLLLLSHKGVGLVDPDEVRRQTDPWDQIAITWTAVDNGVEVFPMTSGAAVVLTHLDGRYGWKKIRYEE